MVSCNKEKTESKSNFLKDASNETESFSLAVSGYEMEQVQSLSGVQNNMYTEGIIEYTKNGKLLAAVNFGEGTSQDKAKLIIDGVESEISLMKEDKNGKYKIVIKQPLVKSVSCGYEIVSGIIEYYEIKSGNWVASIDFGDGTCDDLASKTTKNGVTLFTISDYY